VGETLRRESWIRRNVFSRYVGWQFTFDSETLPSQFVASYSLLTSEHQCRLHGDLFFSVIPKQVTLITLIDSYHTLFDERLSIWYLHPLETVIISKLFLLS
jgi:hypothetical protein